MYRLNEDGKWDDKGTGHVTVSYLEVLFEQSVFSPMIYVDVLSTEELFSFLLRLIGMN